MGWNYHWRATRAVEELERDLDALRAANVKLRAELTSKKGYARKLEVVVEERSRTISDLVGKLEWARELNKRLDAENEHLCEMVKLSP